MKTIFLTLFAALFMALTAPASFAAVIDDNLKKRQVATVAELQPGECTGLANLPLISSFAETRSGKACPDTAFEKGAGQVMFGGVALGIGIEAMGGDVLNGSGAILGGL